MSCLVSNNQRSRVFERKKLSRTIARLHRNCAALDWIPVESCVKHAKTRWKQEKFCPRISSECAFYRLLGFVIFDGKGDQAVDQLCVG